MIEQATATGLRSPRKSCKTSALPPFQSESKHRCKTRAPLTTAISDTLLSSDPAYSVTLHRRLPYTDGLSAIAHRQQHPTGKLPSVFLSHSSSSRF